MCVVVESRVELDNAPGGWSLFCLQERGDLWLFLPRGLDSRENTGAARLRKSNEKLFPVSVLFYEGISSQHVCRDHAGEPADDSLAAHFPSFFFFFFDAFVCVVAVSFLALFFPPCLGQSARVRGRGGNSE